MKNFKHLTIFCLALTIGLFTYKTQQTDVNKEEVSSSWKTFESKGTKITKHASTAKEMRKSNLAKKKKREPASKKITKKRERTITGSLREIFDPKEVTFLNTPKETWQDDFAKSKLNILGKGAKLLINHKDSFIKVNTRGAIYLEKVVVSVQRENKPPMSYEALVNSETGMQVMSWNRTHHENIPDTFTVKLNK